MIEIYIVLTMVGCGILGTIFGYTLGYCKALRWFRKKLENVVEEG